MSSKSESVRVCVRIRPLSPKELQDGRTYIVHASSSLNEISLSNPDATARDPPKKFTFDAAFPPESSQAQVYTHSAKDVVESVVNGFNGTIFAYGQTGAGKSHTMEGASEDTPGIMPTAFTHIFTRLKTEEETQKTEYLVYASYLEIYNEEIRDLLSSEPKSSRLELKESLDLGVYVKDLTQRPVTSAVELNTVMEQGKRNRSVGATLMNQTSSRSHSMFTITVRRSTVPDTKTASPISVGKLHLVDLAGSERQAKTGATGDRMKEATKINLSLSALGNVISALVDSKAQHIPYRDSKLTRLLQDSLGGNAKTVMIANCGPADSNYHETLSTLRYANRAKSIQNKPKLNQDPKDATIRAYQEQIQHLKAALADQEKRSQGFETSEEQSDVQVIERIVEKTIVQFQGVRESEVRNFETQAQLEQQALKSQAQLEMKALLAAQSRTEEEREELERALEAQAKTKHALAQAKEDMTKKLAALEHQTATHERELKAIQASVEVQKQHERQLATELAEKADSKVVLDEQATTLQEVVDDKTKKLKTLWTKYKAVTLELDEVRATCQVEKEQLLDTVRLLTRQLKLKHLLLTHFVPLEDARRLEKRTVYEKENETWRVIKLETSRLEMKRPVMRSDTRWSESEYTRRQRVKEPRSIRWRKENVIQLEFDMPERRTRSLEMENLNTWLERVRLSDEKELEFVATEGEASGRKRLVRKEDKKMRKRSPDDRKTGTTKALNEEEKNRKTTSKRPPTVTR